ncbi:MAG: hypothetical protein H7333_11030, partial [Bdellovibrionales bacterium]|nr:hypothetical protein [Oligoflexia bacterium]
MDKTLFNFRASAIDLSPGSAHTKKKMQKSEKFFIFSWKELVVIGLLILTSVGFFFTLGLHYGKKLHSEVPLAETPSSKLEESPDAVPAKETLDQGTQHAEPAAQDAIKTATQDAIAQSNLKV